MFAKKTKDLLKSLGAQNDLIYNTNLNFQVEMFSLVKVQKKFVHKETTYNFTECTIFDLYTPELAPTDFAGLTTKGRLLDDISTSGGVSASVEGKVQMAPGPVAAAADTAVEAQVEGTLESSSSIFTVQYEKVNMRKLREILKKGTIADLKDLNLEGELETKQSLWSTEKLCFVYKIIKNSTPITLVSSASGSGSIGARQAQSGSVGARGRGRLDLSITIPVGSTLAYDLMEIEIKDQQLSLPFVTKEIKRKNLARKTFGKHLRSLVVDRSRPERQRDKVDGSAQMTRQIQQADPEHEGRPRPSAHPSPGVPRPPSCSSVEPEP